MNKIIKDSKGTKKIIQQINNFVEQTRKITFWSVLKGIFDFFKFEKRINSIQGVDFFKFNDISKLDEIKNILSQTRKNCKHKYKKLHYTYIISRIEDRINEIKFGGGKNMDGMQKLFCVLQPGDVVLINYHFKSYKRNSILRIIINDVLRYLSRSIFVHVGIIGNGNKKIGFELIHSELYNRGVNEISLKKYLMKNKPLELLVLRYSGIKKDQQKKIIDEGIKDVESKINYDLWGAIQALIGLNVIRKKKAFNCGELVYDCLSVIDKNIEIKKYALPASYQDNNTLIQIYLTHF
ncbi:MAG: hypothetical protein WC872_01470 [Candidatus Absconditabacterales bacterium]